MTAKLIRFLGILLVGSSFAATPSVEGVVHVKTVAGISEYRLPVNDLNILLLEDHSAPVLTFMVTYRVGSRDDNRKAWRDALGKKARDARLQVAPDVRSHRNAVNHLRRHSITKGRELGRDLLARSG